MRPHRLEIEGFGTFRDRTVVDFADLDLVAFVGPTGSGKSTVIDAITFALYGSVARYDNSSLVAPVIHQLSAEAKVRFDFEIGGEDYIAVRVVRRRKSKPGAGPQATTREARLERLDGGTSVVVAGNVSELDAEVERLIGLDFRQFTRTIVLPQGDFAEFLTDDPGNRQKLLRRLLDIDIYARMGALARERAARAGQQAEVYEHELARLADATPAALAEIERTAAALAAFAEVAAERLGRLPEIEADLVAKRDAVNQIDGDLARLAEIAVPDGLAEIDSATAAAKTRLTEAEAALVDARRARDAAVEARAAAGDPLLIGERLAARRRQAELIIALAAIEADAVAARTAREEADAGLVDRQRSAEAAAEAVSAARLRADASAWVVRLVEGEPCPVCLQDVESLPDHAGHDDELVDVERAGAEARRALDQQLSAAASAAGRLEAIEVDLAEQRRMADQLAATLTEGALAGQRDDAQPGAEAGVEELEAMLEAASAAGERVIGADAAARDAEAAVAATDAALTTAEAAEGDFRAAFNDGRDRVAELRPPAVGPGTLIDEWRSLAAWSETRAAELGAERAELASAGKELAAAKAELVEALAAGAAAFDIDPSPTTLAAEIAAARARVDARAERQRERLAHAEDLRARVAAMREGQAVDDALGRQHLSATGFERWLLAEALDDMVGRATERLFELSNGRYSLEAVDGSFNVCDHGNADERRDVRTLSGGEIFLASLSLALALADSIAELAPVDSPRLESIFLDEGFGTLDGETLDVLASAIEELSASGRLVAIVTHVRDLAERMPVRFEVRKGPTTSTIERSDG